MVEEINPMKTVFATICAATVFCSVCFAQDATVPGNKAAPPAQPNPAANSSSLPDSKPGSEALRIAPGSVVPVRLDASIDAKKVKIGDNVEAKVTQDLKADNGEVVVAKDTKVVGHVTDAQARSKEHKESRLGIAFDHAVLKDGSDVTLPMSIQAIVAPSYLNPSNHASGGESPEQTGPVPGGGGLAGPGGRSPGLGAGVPAPSPSTSDDESASQSATQHPPVTGKTEGVLGIPNVKLTTPPNPNQGSEVSSEKSNVKLESGTLMLLRVNR
jgi:hypothetical protein